MATDDKPTSVKNTGVTSEGWIGGLNSLLAPNVITDDQYPWSINTVNRGGIIQTRPGYTFLSSILGKKPQGGIIFTPNDSRPMMLVAVDGFIYFSKFPFKDFKKVEGLKFVATAQEIVFQRCLKSAKVNPDTSITIIPSVSVVIIQDGTTKPGYYDGTTARHLEPGTPLFETPIGLRMAWTSSRLWVSNGSTVYVSDLAAPDTFTENTYLAERSNFELPAEVTGMVETSDLRALLVFTETTTTAFQSNIHDRAQWQSTPDFQRIILPKIGCVSGKTPTNQYGSTWWMSRAGFISLDTALYSQHTSVLTTSDGEMTRSKRLMSANTSVACSATFENFLLVSVPAGGKWNEQTWVMDQSPAGAGSKGIWASIWTGTRPVVWMNISFGGREHLYFVSFDATARDGTQIHVWEAFGSDREDNRGRITCQHETRLMTSTELMRFNYAELDLCEILGTVDLSIYVGGMRGGWHLIKQLTLQAEKGSIGSAIQKTIKNDSILRAFKPQDRFIKTEDFSAQNRNKSVDSSEVAGLDKGFQLLLEWSGRMGLRRYKMITTPDTSSTTGNASGNESGKHNILTERGESIIP